MIYSCLLFTSLSSDFEIVDHVYYSHRGSNSHRDERTVPADKDTPIPLQRDEIVTKSAVQPSITKHQDGRDSTLQRDTGRQPNCNRPEEGRDVQSQRDEGAAKYPSSHIVIPVHKEEITGRGAHLHRGSYSRCEGRTVTVQKQTQDAQPDGEVSLHRNDEVAKYPGSWKQSRRNRRSLTLVFERSNANEEKNKKYRLPAPIRTPTKKEQAGEKKGKDSPPVKTPNLVQGEKAVKNAAGGQSSEPDSQGVAAAQIQARQDKDHFLGIGQLINPSP